MIEWVEWCSDCSEVPADGIMQFETQAGTVQLPYCKKCADDLLRRSNERKDS